MNKQSWLNLNNASPTPDNPILTVLNGMIGTDGITIKVAVDTANTFDLHVKQPSALVNLESNDLNQFVSVKSDPKGPSIQVTLDTRKMTWDDETVAKGNFAAYDGVQKQSTEFTAMKARQNEGLSITNAYMRAPNNVPILAWFAEIPVNLDLEHIRRYDLFQAAQQVMQHYRGFEAVSVTSLAVPAMDLRYGVDLPEISNQLPPGGSCSQELLVALDYTGARARARVTMFGSAPPTIQPRQVERLVFGEQGPVLQWFSDVKGQLPFCISASTPLAWLSPEDAPDFNREFST